MRRQQILAAISFIGTFCSLAGQPRAVEDFQPKPVSFARHEMTLREALKALHSQTGNQVEDRRSHPTDPKVTLPAGPGLFWPTLDAIGKQTGIGISAYRPDGGVALIDGPYRELKTHYSGIFRFAVKARSVVQNDETQTHSCIVTMDIAWEPRFQPLYLQLERAAVKYSMDAQGREPTDALEAQTARSVAGAGATELELRMQAPGRTAKSIASLQGTIRVVGAPKMLDFRFPKLKDVSVASPRTLEEEGVKVSLTQAKVSATRWTVDVLIENPKGTILPLESFQSWMDNNRIWLEWTDPNTKVVRRLEPAGEAPQADSRGAKIRHEFTALEKVPLPPSAAEVTLHYRTPNRVAAYLVPFEFRDLPLP